MDDKENSRIQASFTYRPIYRSLWRERYLFLAVFLAFIAVVAYRSFSGATQIQADRIPRYQKVLGDFDRLTGDFEAELSGELERKKTTGVGAVNAQALKNRLYLIYDYMYVWEMREDSPFYRSFPPQEHELIRTLISLGKMLDAAIIRIAESSGNPAVPVDFAMMRSELRKAGSIVGNKP
ncbi:MAG: hypothetical protein WC889_18440 [Myxococcota bacterium]|jgi:hypothetical protein